MPDSFVSLLARIARLEAELKELTQRVHPIQVAVVTDVDDKAGQRRIRVSREVQGGQSQTDWIQAGRATCYTDEPLPPVGTTVLIGAVEGNPHDLHLLRTLSNNTNPPDQTQASPVDDLTTEIPGNDRRVISGDHYHGTTGKETRETDGDVAITCNGDKYQIDAPSGRVYVTALQEIVLSNQSGASLTLQANGAVLIQDAYGHKWTLGGDSGSQWVWDLNGGAIAIINASDVAINGKSAIVVGSTDSHGDTNNTRGY